MLHLRFEGRRSLTTAKRTELHKDDRVLDHGAQAPDQPRQIGQEVLFLRGVEQDSRAVRRVTQQTQHEEEQTETLATLLPLVLDDLRNARAQIANRTCVP